jgi:hypothetical protein
MKLSRTKSLLVAGAFGWSSCSKASAPPTTAPDPLTVTADDSGSANKKKAHKAGDKHQPMAADAVALTLDVAVGSDMMTWKKDDFAKVAEYTLGSDGNARDVWSMRDLATQLVGSNAHVVAVTGEGGTKAMGSADWMDSSKTPVLHTTRRGTLKFTWADGQGNWGETVVKDVTRIEIAR